MTPSVAAPGVTHPSDATGDKQLRDVRTDNLETLCSPSAIVGKHEHVVSIREHFAPVVRKTMPPFRT